MLKLISLLLLLFFNGSLFSQSPRIARFSISPVNDNKLIVNWTMTAGSTCPTVEVQRSNNGRDFETVYYYPSICGNSDKEESYNWIDANPKLYSINYYRIKLTEREFTLPLFTDFIEILSDDL